MNKRTRLKLTIAIAIYLMALGVLSCIFKLENATIAVVTALTGSILGYFWAETSRPSNKE